MIARAVTWSMTLGLALLPQPAPGGAPPFDGRLFTVISRWEPSRLDPVRDTARVDKGLQARFRSFARCLNEFRSRLPRPADFFQEAASGQQRALERALACTAEDAGAAALATAYVRRAVILYEWEGDYSSPLQEAAHAQRFISANPRSPLTAFLHVFVALRFRSAFELLDGDKSDSETVRVAQGYLKALADAKASSPLMALIADDLDRLPFVYRDIGKHPRDFQ